MNRWKCWTVSVGLVAFVFPNGHAAEEFKLEEGYTLLFNGKDLTGWVVKGSKDELSNKTDAASKRFETKDGAIVINEKDSDGKGGIKDLYTVKEFEKPFHLKLEFRAAKNADSGVYIRGHQLQVRDYPNAGPYKNLKKFKDGDWNELDITVKKVEGKDEWIAECRCNGEVLEEKFKVPAKGAIGVQAEGGKFEFRRVRIKEMDK